jgi:nucleoside-diphosphate-sugar epimerase
LNLLEQVHGDHEKDADGWPTYLNPQARRIKANILDDGAFAKSLKGVTHLVHLAASVGVGQSMSNIFDYTRNNTLAAALMLDVLSKGRHSVKRMAVASSMSIYGEGEYRVPGHEPRVENGDLVPPPKKQVDQMRPDKPSAARNQHMPLRHSDVSLFARSSAGPNSSAGCRLWRVRICGARASRSHRFSRSAPKPAHRLP